MDLKLEEITDEVLVMKEKEIEAIAAGIASLMPTSQRRMDTILKKAKTDLVLKDSAEFIAEGFGKGLLGIVDTVICLGSNKPPKRSF